MLVTNIRYSSVHTFLQEGTVYNTAVFCSRLSCRSRDRLTQFLQSPSIRHFCLSSYPSALSSSLSLSHHWLWDLRLPIYCIVYKIYFWQYKLTKKIDGCESGFQMKGCNSCQTTLGEKSGLLWCAVLGEELKPAFYFLPTAIPLPSPHPENSSKKRGFCGECELGLMENQPSFLYLANAGKPGTKNCDQMQSCRCDHQTMRGGGSMCTNLVRGKKVSVLSPQSLIL